MNSPSSGKPSPSTVARTYTRAFGALRHRDFRLMWFGLLVSVAGTQMQATAINWHIYELTRSPLALGMIGLARLIPIILFSLAGGVVADTRNRRRVMVVTQSVMMGAACLLGLVTHLGIVSAGWIYLVGFIGAGAAAFDLPARQSLIPNLVPREDLTNAITLGNVVFQTATIIGPGLAGIIIGSIGIAWIYWFNAVSFLAVIAALVLMHTPTPPRGEHSQSGLKSLQEGFRFVIGSRIIFSTMLLDFFATFFAGANTLLPVFATDILRVGPEGYGILAAAESIGSLITGAFVSLWGDIKAKGVTLLTGVMIYAGATIGFGLSPWFALSMLFLMLIGAGDTLSTILRSTIRQLVTPDHLRGRMTSINMIFFMGGPQLGEIEAGIVAALIGAPLAVAFGGVLTVTLVALTAYQVPALRNYEG